MQTTDYMLVLMSFIIIGTLISIAVSLINLLVKPYVDIKKYSLTTGFALSVLIFSAFNVGVMKSLGIPVEGVTIEPYFHIVDVGLTSILGIGGAKGFRLFIKKMTEVKK